MMILRCLALLLGFSLVSIMQAEMDTPEDKKASEYKVLYSGKKSTLVNKQYQTKTISPQVLERIKAYEQTKRLSTKMANVPGAIEVKVINFAEKLDYTSEAVSMKVIQAVKPVMETESVDIDKTVVEKVIAVREDDKVDITTVNKFSKIQEKEEAKEK